ncbi:hypothetical protein CERSUDRAFT_117601 [Gelatoporia subvermispora B]|uniref:Myb-like domain-containing protein n=1 Tax=Ceriporiopsis subvermispora (strain B) TaxID=914234 RepID=M2QPJ7_CERS8|nr:hypothetical protein CERSUDRAFT_117601 [Gelatoporia subvermispora B]
MDNPQYYQPLSHALNPPIVSAGRSPQQQYTSYSSHAHSSAANGTATGHREEEEEEEDDDEGAVEEELEHQELDGHPGSTQSSPRAANAQAQTAGAQVHISQDQAHHGAGDVDGNEKRKPGRPRGSRNRKPRAPAGTATKAPANTQHPGFYQYPPAPGGGALSQNQQFYEFQWRALNLCSEFYNAAEELVKAASPLVIAQCYQMGPATKVDPLAMIADAKRVCDNLLANPSQLVGQPPPAVYSSVPSYPQMPPPPQTAPPPVSASSSTPSTVITNPQSFVMSLGAPAMPPPSHPQSYYPPMYAAPGARYPTAPYYSYQPPTTYYPPPTQPTPTPAAPAPPAAAIATTTPTPAVPTSASTGTITTFNAATGSTTAGGQQGTWSEDETEKLRRLAEQSKEMGGAQNKGEIEWDWVVQQWGNSRTRHQILLKATNLGLKVSTSRGTKRRRETESATDASDAHPQQPQQAQQTPTATPAAVHQTLITTASAPPSSASQSPSISTHTAPIATPKNASPHMQPQRPPSSQPTSIAPARTQNPPPPPSNLPWPMPTVAANTPSPVLTHTQPDQQRNAGAYYRARPTQTTSYGAAAAASNASTSRPTSSHGAPPTHHTYMYHPNGSAGQRR